MFLKNLVDKKVDRFNLKIMKWNKGVGLFRERLSFFFIILEFIFKAGMYIINFYFLNF